MYCPKCGQNQINDGVRFCSRCGLQLSEVSSLLAVDGGLPPAASEKRGEVSLYRQITSQVGAKIIFLSLILAPFALMACFAVDSPIPLVIALMIFAVGLAQIAYFRIFGDSVSLAKSPPPAPTIRADDRSGLSPAGSDAVPRFAIKSTDTAEIVQPPSVTEPTTRLLELDGGREVE